MSAHSQKQVFRFTLNTYVRTYTITSSYEWIHNFFSLVNLRVFMEKTYNDKSRTKEFFEALAN